jgi:FixJ family two-component response regulator
VNKWEITLMQVQEARNQSLETSSLRTPHLPTVFIVDEDSLVRESLEELIQTAGYQVESFASAEQFLARPRALRPGCLILDVALPQLDGLALQEIIADRRETPLIFVTAQHDIRVTVRAMKAGAVDFLTKPFNGAALLSAVQSALERSRHALAREAAMRILNDRYASLTPREREVLRLVVTGLLNKQIAAELAISEITVKAHRGKVMRKMAADSLAELVTIAARLPFHASAN